MKENIYYLWKGAIIGILLFFTLLFLASMVLDDGIIVLNINKYGEGWIETILLAWLTIFSIIKLKN